MTDGCQKLHIHVFQCDGACLRDLLACRSNNNTRFRIQTCHSHTSQQSCSCSITAPMPCTRISFACQQGPVPMLRQKCCLRPISVFHSQQPKIRCCQSVDRIPSAAPLRHFRRAHATHFTFQQRLQDAFQQGTIFIVTNFQGGSIIFPIFQVSPSRNQTAQLPCPTLVCFCGTIFLFLPPVFYPFGCTRRLYVAAHEELLDTSSLFGPMGLVTNFECVRDVWCQLPVNLTLHSQCSNDFSLCALVHAFLIACRAMRLSNEAIVSATPNLNGMSRAHGGAWTGPTDYP